MELGIFKDILSNPPIGTKDDLRPNDSSAQVLKSPIADVLTATKLTRVEKKNKRKKGGGSI